MASWESRIQDLLAKKEPLWKLKAELYDLAITDLDPVLATMQDMGNQVRCRAELRECLSAVEDIVGIFNVGGGWGHHTAVDLRFRPSMTALRMSQLVRHHLRALTHFDGSPIKVWVPLSQGEMSRKRKRQGGEEAKGRGRGGRRDAGQPGREHRERDRRERRKSPKRR